MISTSALLMAACLAATGAETPISVGAQKQLFLDDHLIESKTNITRRVHPARKFSGNPVKTEEESPAVPN